MYCDNKLISVTVTYVNIYRPICAWWRPWFLCIRVEGALRTLTLKICALGVRAIARARPRRGLGTIYTPTKLGGVNHPRQWRQWAPGPISLEYLSAIREKAHTENNSKLTKNATENRNVKKQKCTKKTDINE